MERNLNLGLQEISVQTSEELAYSLDAISHSTIERESSIKYTLEFETARQLNKAIQTLQQAGYPAYRSSRLNPKDNKYELIISMKTNGDKPDSNDRDLVKCSPVGSNSSQQNHTDSRFAKTTPDIVREVPEGFYHIKSNPLKNAEVIILYNMGELRRDIVPINKLRDKIMELKELELRSIDEHPRPKAGGKKQKAEDDWLDYASI